MKILEISFNFFFTRSLKVKICLEIFNIHDYYFYLFVTWQISVFNYIAQNTVSQRNLKTLTREMVVFSPIIIPVNLEVLRLSAPRRWLCQPWCYNCVYPQYQNAISDYVSLQKQVAHLTSLSIVLIDTAGTQINLMLCYAWSQKRMRVCCSKEHENVRPLKSSVKITSRWIP